MDLHDGDEGSVEVVGFWFLGVENLYREGTTWNGEDGTFIEIFGELFGVEGGRGNDDLKIWPTLD